MADGSTGPMPMNAMMGWTEGVESKKDAIELAKGFIGRRYTAVEASWFSVAPFMGGYLWEVHEGGPGVGYIGSVVEALSANPGSKFWFPSGERVFQIMMRDGKPFGVLLSKADSLSVKNSGQPRLAPVTKMKPAVRKGTATLMAGAAMAGSGGGFLLASMIFYAFLSAPGPSVPAVDPAQLPHSQWQLVIGTKVDEIVSKLELKDGEWGTEKRPHEVPGLKELRDRGQQLIKTQPTQDAQVPEVERDEQGNVLSPMAEPAGSGAASVVPQSDQPQGGTGLEAPVQQSADVPSAPPVQPSAVPAHQDGGVSAAPARMTPAEMQARLKELREAAAQKAKEDAVGQSVPAATPAPSGPVDGAAK